VLHATWQLGLLLHGLAAMLNAQSQQNMHKGMFMHSRLTVRPQSCQGRRLIPITEQQLSIEAKAWQLPQLKM